MDTEMIKTMMRERLTTKALAEDAARICEISVATLYRYKSDPSQMPVGVLIKLAEYLGYPLSDGASWTKADPLVSEQRRLQLERELASSGGDRLAVTTAYAVTCELPEVRRALWDADYGSRHSEKLEQYIAIRCERRGVYRAGAYRSFEIIMGNAYRDFFNAKGIFSTVPADLRSLQIAELIESLDLPHIKRRVYNRNTPELPVFQTFGTISAAVRIDDIVFEHRNPALLLELTEVFHDYYDRCDVKSVDEVKAFYQNPNKFLI